LVFTIHRRPTTTRVSATARRRGRYDTPRHRQLRTPP
jgi:hypothetical protein